MTGRTERTLGPWIVGGALLLILLRFLPLLPAFPTANLDAGYQLALHAAFAQGLEHGTEVVYTYGPLGFLEHRTFHPATFGWVIAWWSVLALTLGWSALRIVGRLGLRPAPAAAWLAVWLWTADPFFALLLSVWFLALDDPERPAALRALHAFTLAVLILGKASNALGALPLLALLAAGDLRARRVPWELVGVGLGVVVLWPASGQSLSALAPYLARAQEVVAGHAQAMVVKGRAAHLERIGFLVPTLLLGIALGRWRPERRALRLTGLALILFLAAKSGFVRHDGHVLTATRTVFLAALLALPILRVRGRKPVVAVGGLIAATLLAHLGAIARHPYDPLHELRPRAAWRTVTGGWSGLADADAAARSGIRAGAALPPLEGTVDLYTNDVAVALALPNAWRPRPVFQSFLAYTPELAHLNAAHLRGDRAADTIVFEPSTIDRRYPSLDDGASWPELLTRYRVAAVTDRFCVLKRRATPAAWSLARQADAELALGAWHPVPFFGDRPVWAELDVPTGGVLARAATLVHRLPRIFIDVQLGGGEETTYRLIPGAARAGFVLSPRIVDALGFAELAARSWRSADVTAIRVRTHRLLGSTFRLRLSRLDYAAQDLARFDLPRRRYPGFKVPPKLVRGVSSIYVLGDGRRVFHNHPPGSLHLHGVGPTLRLRFGILERAWTEGRTDGVTFRAVAGDRVLWSRHLDPRRVAADRGEQSVRVKVPPGAQVRLEVDAGPQGDPAWDWAYWSQVDG